MNKLILSPEEIQEINAEISHYPDKAAVAIEALKIVQKHRRWVSDDCLVAVAELLGHVSRRNWKRWRPSTT